MPWIAGTIAITLVLLVTVAVVVVRRMKGRPIHEDPSRKGPEHHGRVTTPGH